jgi:nitrate reductase assembly molybdenum cofactor insertion protein NarJ
LLLQHLILHVGFLAPLAPTGQDLQHLSAIAIAQHYVDLFISELANRTRLHNEAYSEKDINQTGNTT